MAAHQPKQVYTSWIRRRSAFIIDEILVLLLVVILAVIGGAIVAAAGGTPCTIGARSCSPSVGPIVWSSGALVVLAYCVWNWGYRQGVTGSSIGKSVLKFKVVSERTGQPIGFGMSVVRQIAHLLDAISFIGFVLPLFTAKRQTIADMVMARSACRSNRHGGRRQAGR
jgi:uncharacterized RDD family membrane protein YckC